MQDALTQVLVMAYNVKQLYAVVAFISLLLHHCNKAE